MSTDFDIIYFDGECNLCNGVVQMIIRNDPDRHFKFATLQHHHPYHQNPDKQNAYTTLILKTEDSYWEESDAVLRILQHLRFPWPWVGKLFGALPQDIRDGLYRYVSRYRFKIFGRRNSCMVPTSEIMERFI